MITSDSRQPLEYQVPFRCRVAILDRLDPKLLGQIGKALTDKYGAVIHGPTGLGKTYAMVAVMREQGTPERQLFVDWPEFIGDVDRFREIETPDRERFDPRLRLFGWKGPLFIDDVGQEHAAVSGYRKGESESIFDQFINRRTGQDDALWITTNLSPKEIRERYGDRTLSRLSEHCLFIPLVGSDKRLAV